MSEMDDIFEITEYLKKAPKHVRKVWKEHLLWHYECQATAEKYGDLRQAARTVLLHAQIYKTSK